jgi:hypothetical protein
MPSDARPCPCGSGLTSHRENDARGAALSDLSVSSISNQPSRASPSRLPSLAPCVGEEFFSFIHHSVKQNAEINTALRYAYRR